jgi:DNA-binding NarL/FixJ family response regulator
MKLLLVDDAANVRKRIASLIRDIDGVEVVIEAENGAQAIDLARSMRPDFVILDLDLPGTSGLEILPMLKGLWRAPTVLVLTNHAGEAFARRSQELGADYFFDKSKQFQSAIEAVRSSIAARPKRV